MNINFDKCNFRQIYKQRDEYYFQQIEEMLKQEKIDIRTLLTNYMAFVRRRDFAQQLSYYEIFKKIMHLPGSIVEVGVFLGNGLFTWVKLLETFLPNVRGRKAYGFDNFEGYSQEILEVDKKPLDYIKKIYKNDFLFKLNKELVQNLVKINNLDLTIMGIERAILYDEDFDISFKKFADTEYGVRICLLVVDVNLFTPTKEALNFFRQKIVKNGLIVLRGYGVKPWEGESKAVDDFMFNHCNEFSVVDVPSFSMYPSIILKKDI